MYRKRVPQRGALFFCFHPIECFKAIASSRALRNDRTYNRNYVYDGTNVTKCIMSLRSRRSREKQSASGYRRNVDRVSHPSATECVHIPFRHSLLLCIEPLRGSESVRGPLPPVSPEVIDIKPCKGFLAPLGQRGFLIDVWHQ
jgi:hypothetical protein